MTDVQPYISFEKLLCVEEVAPPVGLVVFGASGDLTRRKLIKSMLQLYLDNLLTDRFFILGCARSEISDEEFREIASQSAEENEIEYSQEKLESFRQRCFFCVGDYADPKFYEKIKARLTELDKQFNVHCCHVFYLSVPPKVYTVIAENLGRTGLSEALPDCKHPPRIVIEKPFGHDLNSAIALNESLREHFNESQIYRIDHYLGKETVQNILMFRFANAIFEPIWNRNYIDHVQITLAESIGVEHRAGYYDTAGTLRDMFQNHVLGMVAFVAMEAPAGFEADRIRDEKVKLLRCIRPVELDPWSGHIVRARYTAGQVDGSDVPGYLEEEGVDPRSAIETFVAAKLHIDNWRWRKVPFYIRSGKRLAKKVTEVAITFRHVPHSMFSMYGIEELPQNVLVLKIQPEEGIYLSFQAKSPGAKACITTLTMNFNYSQLFGTAAPEAYQRLLLDCMAGDQTLFNRQDDVEICWKLLDPILKVWESDGSSLFEYPAGAESFGAADELIQSDGRNWRRINRI